MTEKTFLAAMVSGPFIERLGWMLVHTLWQFAVIALAALLLLSLMKKTSAALRHGVLMGHLALLIMIPPVTWLVLGQGAVLSEDARSSESDSQGMVLERPDRSPRPTELASGSHEPAAVVSLSTPSKSSEFLEASTPLSNTKTVSETNVATEPSITALWNHSAELVRPWLGKLVVIWAVGLLLFSLRPMLGWWALRRLKTRGLSAVPESIAAMGQSLAKRMGITRRIQVLQSLFAKTPLLVGYVQPVILLPISVVAGIPASQLEAILIHELAHVRRHDFLVNLLQTLVETVFFYHPAVWFLSSRIRIERENCCDDLVVGIVQDRAEYGRALLAVEELRGNQSILALGATHGSLLARVRRILMLEPKGPGVLGRWPLVSLAPICLGLCLLFQQLGAAPSVEKPESESPNQSDAPPEVVKDANDQDWPMPVLGRVLMRDGSPAVGAEVRAVLLRPGSAAESRRETRTDGEGRFRLALPVFASRDGSWVVSARAGALFGRSDQRVLLHARNRPAMRPEAENINDIWLQPGRKIEGLVLTQKNRAPLAKATVWASDGQRTETDEKGAFVLHGLARQVQGLLITHPEAARTRIHVDLSEQETGKVHVLLPPSGMIQGEVTHSEQPVQDGRVYAGIGSSQMDAGLTETIDPVTGKFSFDGLPFNCLLSPLSFSAAGMEPLTTEPIALRPGQPQPPHLKIALQKSALAKSPDSFSLGTALAGTNQEPRGSIRGKVRDQNGKPVTEFTVHLLPGVDRPSGESGSFSHPSRSFFSEDGTFAIGQLDPGKKYRVAVTCPSYDRAIMSPITARVYDPKRLSEVEQTEFPLKPAAVQMEMIVRDAKTQKPIPNAMVCFKADVWPREEFSWDFGRIGAFADWTDEQGKILWNPMEIEEGLFFVTHPGYGRGHIPWNSIARQQANATTPTGNTPVRISRLDVSSEKYRLELNLNPEAKLEVKINQAGGRDLQGILVAVEQLALPGPPERAIATNPLIRIPDPTEKSAKGDLFQFDRLNPGICKVIVRDAVDEHGGLLPGPVLVRQFELVSGVYRLELDLPSRPSTNPAKVEKKEDPQDPNAARFLYADEATINALKLEKKLLLVDYAKDHPKVKKITMQIEHLEKIKQARASSDQGNLFVAGKDSTRPDQNDDGIRIIHVKKNQSKTDPLSDKKIQSSLEEMESRLEELTQRLGRQEIENPALKNSPLEREKEYLQGKIEATEALQMDRGVGTWKLEGGVVIDVRRLDDPSSDPMRRKGVLRSPDYPQKNLFGPTTQSDKDWCVGWMKGGTTVWAVTRSDRSLKIHEVRFGPMDQSAPNELWSKETTIPWVRGQAIEDAGIPSALAIAFAKALTGEEPVVMHKQGKWILNDGLTWELKEQALYAPLVGQARKFVGILRNSSTNQLVKEIPLGMVQEKDRVSIIVGWLPVNSVLWVALKNGSAGDLTRINWNQLDEFKPATHTDTASAGFPGSLRSGGVEIPVALSAAMAEQLLILEGKKPEAGPGSALPAAPTTLPAVGPATAADQDAGGVNKTAKRKSAKATALLRERVKMTLEALKSGQVQVEAAISACKDLAELEPAEALKNLETMLEVAQERVKAGIGTKREVLAVQSIYEIIKLRVTPEP